MSGASSELRRTHATTIEGLYRRADAARWDLPPEDFADALERSSAARFRGEPARGEEEVREYLESLRVDDLALAAACARGSATAWERVVTEYRPLLYRAARALLRDESRAREIADALWADLYGLAERDGRRRSLFEYFHGRSSLAGWLRALVARRHVDVRRADRRTDPLDDVADERLADPRPGLDGADPDRTRWLRILRDALLVAFAALGARDRLRLSCYHLREMNLAEIGRLFGEHESTVSRKLDRTRRSLRREVGRILHRERMSEDQIRLCYQYATEEWPYDLGGALSEETGKKGGVRRSTIEGEPS